MNSIDSTDRDAPGIPKVISEDEYYLRLVFSTAIQLSVVHLTNNFYHFQEFEGNRQTEESLPSFPGITGIFMEFEGNRLTGDSLPSFPGIPENFLEFEGNRLTGKSHPSFPGIPGIIHEDKYY